MAQHYGIFTIMDYSQEKSPFKFFNGAITGASIAGYITQFGAMRTAIQGLVLGTVVNEQWVGDNTILSNTPPTDPDAQRERKALVVYKGNTNNKLYTATLPTVRTKDGDDNPLILPGTDKFDLTAPLVAAFVTAFQAIGRTPDSDLENVTVIEMRLVGRNI